MAYEFRKMNLSGTDINVKDEEARAGISEAVTKATAAQANADSALTSVTAQNVAIASVQADVGAQNTDIVNLKAKVGTGVLNTTAQNLIGAVNELRQNITGGFVTERITGTTTISGAIEIPTRLRPYAFIGALILSGGPGFVFRRDHGYFTVMSNEAAPIANTEVSFNVYFLNI